MARPTRPILSRARICATALDIVDRDGLDELSMRKLARELGVQVSSLYEHVKTKDDVLHEVANAIMEGVDVSGFEAGDWRHGVASWARSYRAALAAHPHIVPFLAYGPARREASLRRADAVHGGLVAAGWPPRYATMIGASTKYLVIGSAMTSFARGFDDDVQVYVERYASLADAHRLPDHADTIDRDSFELALEMFLDGLGRLHERVASRDDQERTPHQGN
ncbi:TetR/AcrR family transcriptional regulator [Streptomyces shaanxiensis]|uniref:TetR/AcrR family transcriptional regulator C-terminal domain-containing protein n=1 Tax=Streptomyces shaanxiensis TaxID=653357 RepID=A0ABP7VQ47_9ACTN